MGKTGKYTIKIVLKHFHSWNQDRKRGEYLCYKSSQETTSMNNNA
jgi:hypothetical protein